jgi:hypothetical protein
MSQNAGGGGEGGCGVSANAYSCEHGARINFGDLTPYLTYAADEKRYNTFGLIKPHQDVSPYFIKRNDTSIRFSKKIVPFRYCQQMPTIFRLGPN